MQDLAELLLGFVDRDEGGALVLACEDAEVAVPIHLLAELATRSPQDRFVVTAEGIADPSEVVAAIARAAGMESAAVDDAPALGRLIDDLLRDLPEGEGRLVVAVVPTSLAPSVELAPLFADVLDALPPRLRLIVRDRRRPRGSLVVAAERRSDTALIALDLGFAAEELRALQAAAAGDPGLDLRERRAALLQVGWTELGAGRLEVAAGVFEGLAEAHAAAGERGAEAYAWMGLAEVRRRLGDADGARAADAAALVCAAEGGDLLVVAHLALALAQAAVAAGASHFAERGFGLAEAVAADLQAVQLFLDARCGRAGILRAQGRPDAAVEALEGALVIARAAGDARAEAIAAELATLRGTSQARRGAGGGEDEAARQGAGGGEEPGSLSIHFAEDARKGRPNLAEALPVAGGLGG